PGLAWLRLARPSAGRLAVVRSANSITEGKEPPGVGAPAAFRQRVRLGAQTARLSSHLPAASPGGGLSLRPLWPSSEPTPAARRGTCCQTRAGCVETPRRGIAGPAEPFAPRPPLLPSLGDAVLRGAAPPTRSGRR